MGVGNSVAVKKKKDASAKFYRPPDVRQKDRYEPEETSIFSNQNDSSIDKFDYLIVFPLTEGAYANPNHHYGDTRVSWDIVSASWSKGVPGTEATKREAVGRLKEFWKNRCGLYPKSGDELLAVAWATVARETIVDTLLEQSGLQLKLSGNQTSIFCRIRAPIKLLEVQASKENYRLQFKGEIDPGSRDFWNKEINRKIGRETKKISLEVEEEKVLYSREEANAILERLYRAGKISPNDLTVDTDVEIASTWSRRVHALERIADKVPVYNNFPAYSPFTLKPQLRYLYQTYPSVRGKTLFRSKDRLFLTKSIVDMYFDMGIFKEEGIVSGLMALHDANRGDKLTIDILKRRWVTAWQSTASEVGGPMITNKASDEDKEAAFYQRPFSQPLGNIREYFGEKVALYYAWIGFYTVYLLFPATIGVLMMVLYKLRGYEYTISHLDYFLISFVVLIITWSAVYKQSWDREEKAIALKWGTRGYESQERDRPQFRGDPENPLKRSFITNRKETYYPQHKRFWIEAYSMTVVFVTVILATSFFGACFYAEYLVMTIYTEFDIPYLSWVVIVIISIAIEWFSIGYIVLSESLTNQENHKTETNYENSLITKTLFFKLFNNYSALIFTAFFKGPFLGTCATSCIYDLQMLLYGIFIVRFLVSIWSMISPYFRKSVQIINGNVKPANVPNGDLRDLHGEEMQVLHSEPDDNVNFAREVDLEPYNGTFHDYAEAVLQFGYVNLFSAVLPYIALVALLENLLKIRLDAWKLCTFTQRPHIQIAEDVGGWANLMDMMSILGIVCSTAILCFSDEQLNEYSAIERIIIFLIAQQVLVLYKYFISSFLPEDPEWVSEMSERNIFISDKYVHSVQENDDDLDLLAIKGNLDDLVDKEGLGLFDLRKSKKTSESDYEDMEKLETRRRVFLRELQTAKDLLNVVFKTETFNDTTGIGESKHGLPLGRLNVRIVSMKFTAAEILLFGDNPQIKLRVTIKGTRAGGTDVGPPVGPRSFSSPLVPKDGTVSLNQSLGPFAPIRTQDADIVIDALDIRVNRNEAVVASTSLRLRELQDQENHDIALHLKMRQADGTLLNSSATLYVTMLFQFSKVSPIRSRIYGIQDKLRAVEKELNRIKGGKEKENDVY